MPQIPDAGYYFSNGCGRCDRFATADCAAMRWAEVLRRLRNICLSTGLVEAIKWSHPCYIHSDRNIAILGALQGEVRLSFFNAALLKDPERVLERQGPNTRFPDMIRFSDLHRVAEMEAIIRRYLIEAMGHAELGTKPPKPAFALGLPKELAAALGSDPTLAEAFHGLTPGRQRSYVINLNSAKKTQTRIARIISFRNKILAGKGAMDP